MRVFVNIERGIISGSCYYCRCPSLEIKKEKEEIVSCPNCGKQFFIVIRPQQTPLGRDFWIRFFGCTDSSSIEIIPHSYQKAHFPVDEFTRRFFESDDPSYETSFKEAYLREKIKRNK